MIKYVVQHKITKCFRIAFKITHISDENEYLKEKYNFLVSACSVGKFLIVDEETGIHFVMSGHAFNEGYDIVKRTVMVPTTPAMRLENDELRNCTVAGELHDIYGVKTDRVTQDCSESDPIQKITVDDVAKLRKELFKEKLDKAVQSIRLDIPSMYPTSTLDICKEVRKWSETWPTPCHLDIRDMADMRKANAKEKTDMKTSITLDIKKVIFNDPATIVIWADGTKTVVKCKEGETYSKWAGLALCYAKRINGEKFHSEFKHWCGEDEEPTEETMAKAFNESGPIDYRDVIIKNRDDAKRIIDDMTLAVHEFGSISLADYCDMVGASHKLSDYYIGWTTTDKVGVLTIKNGYKIILPEPGSIQSTVSADSMKDSDFMFKVKDVKFNIYSVACDIRHDMHECIAKYGYVTVLDYYDLTHTKYDKEEAEIAQHYGWDDTLCGPEIRWDGEGKCYLNLPSPKNLDFKKAIDEIKQTE